MNEERRRLFKEAMAAFEAAGKAAEWHPAPGTPEEGGETLDAQADEHRL